MQLMKFINEKNFKTKKRKEINIQKGEFRYEQNRF